MAIVVSHIASDFDALARQALRQAPLADLIELRLDRIGDPGRAALEAFVKESPRPVIVACPGPEAHGEFAGSVDERLDLLAGAAEAGAAFVDVDWTLSLELGEVAGKCHRIVSRHDPEGTPADLESWHEEVRELLYEGDVTKLVGLARSTEDGLRMLHYVRSAGGGLIGFCSGEKGSFTRLLAPIFGSPFIYAAAAVVPDLPVPEPTAPGQIRAGELHGLLPPGGLSQETAIFAVVGNPVGASWSPRVHGMALKAARLDAVYVALEPESLDAFLELARDPNFRGLSVTAPFKQRAFELARECDGVSTIARAVNTLVRDGEGWRGANTDAPAVRETLERAFRMHALEPGRPVALAVARTLVLGTGGAARAAVAAVRGAGGEVVVAGRDVAKARRLVAELGGEAIAWDDVASCQHDVLVHATPVGSLADPDRLPIPAEWLRPGTLVLDAVYRPLRTPLLAAALERGCTAVPGGEWFVRQAREQFRMFTNTDADETIMRAAFEHALGARA